MPLPPADWPQRAASRTQRVGALDWHVQVAGRGPVLLLLHGTGASTHSFAALLPKLAAVATVVLPDLPGHGYTTGATPADLSLPRMAQSLLALLKALALPAPRLVVGHSAGAALGLRLALAGTTPPRAVLGFNPSLVAPPAAYLNWVAPVLNPLATSAPVAALLARLASGTGMVDGLLDSTGSTLTPAQRAWYARLFARPEHVRGAMGFMAAADLPALLPECAALPCAAAFVLGRADRWVPEADLRPVLQRWFPRVPVEAWPGGHLLHEEDPARAAAKVLEWLA